VCCHDLLVESDIVAFCRALEYLYSMISQVHLAPSVLEPSGLSSTYVGIPVISCSYVARLGLHRPQCLRSTSRIWLHQPQGTILLLMLLCERVPKGLNWMLVSFFNCMVFVLKGMQLRISKFELSVIQIEIYVFEPTFWNRMCESLFKRIVDIHNSLSPFC